MIRRPEDLLENLFGYPAREWPQHAGKMAYARHLRIYFDNRRISVVNMNQLKQLTTNERGKELQ
jgi:hypothetical protein